MYPQTLETLGDHIRKVRLDRGLMQKDAAKAMGVSEAAVSGWEKHWRGTRCSFLPKIIAFLGYLPPPFTDEAATVSERIRLYRQTKGLRRERFAELLGVDDVTVYRWEKGLSRPSGELAVRLEGMIGSPAVLPQASQLLAKS